MKWFKQSTKAFPAMKRACLAALLCYAALNLSGCATSEPENYSSRPWDSPKSWETGLPSALTEGR